MEKIEYRVRPVTRYFVTRYHETERTDDRVSASSSSHGEFDNEHTAYSVGYALCRAEHERLGWPLDDERIQYPPVPGSVSLDDPALAGISLTGRPA